MNKKQFQKAALSTLFLVAWGVGGTAMADQGKLSLTTGVDYSSGKYGGASSTDILYIPFTGKYEADKWSLKLTVPYIRITGPGNVVREVGLLGNTSNQRTTQSGLGDVVAAGTYNVYDGGNAGTLFDLTGKVKFGTADETKGLGTGKTDYALQIDGYQSIGETTAFGSVGYKVFGKPAGFTLNNVWYGSVGAGHKINQQTSGGLILDLRQKASDAGAPQREITAYLSHKYSDAWKAQAYVVKGFADGSPDWGGGAMVTFMF